MQQWWFIMKKCVIENFLDRSQGQTWTECMGGWDIHGICIESTSLSQSKQRLNGDFL